MLRGRTRNAAATVDRAAQREAFRVLRSNLEVTLADLERPTVVVTSANAGEGKTTTCAHLARTLALAGRRVVAVDLDLRHPDLHHQFGGENVRGVTEVLLDRCALADAMQYVAVGLGPAGTELGLYLLSTGSAVASPTELLGSPRLARLLDSLTQQADVLLLDAPPVLPVADTLVIGRMAAGALLVVHAGVTPYHEALRAKDALVRNGTRMLGTVLNAVEGISDSVGYGYGYPESNPVPLPRSGNGHAPTGLPQAPGSALIDDDDQSDL